MRINQRSPICETEFPRSTSIRREASCKEPHFLAGRRDIYFVIGLLADLIALLGGAGSFKTQAFVVLVGIAVLGVLLFSERIRQKIRNFVSRHLKGLSTIFEKYGSSLRSVCRACSIVKPSAQSRQS